MSALPPHGAGQTPRELVRLALATPAGEPGLVVAEQLSDAADRRTRDLIDRFVHANGPAPARFAWVALGSHARGELHLASDQDHALLWDTRHGADSSYAADLAADVIAGLGEFGMQPCSGHYMADQWSRSLDDWLVMLRDHIEAPTPKAVLDTDIFLDMRALSGDLDVASALALLRAGAQSPRLLHGLAVAADSFGVPLTAFGRLPRDEVDLKKGGLAALVLLARLYGLQSDARGVGTLQRFAAAQEVGVLSPQISTRLRDAFQVLVDLRLRHQIDQVRTGEELSDRVAVADLSEPQQEALRTALRSVKEAQAVTALTFRTDL